MRTDGIRRHLQGLLDPAGVAINGNAPWDIRVTSDEFYGRVMRDGSLGLGEAYMDGQWECEDLDGFFSRVLPFVSAEAVAKKWSLLAQALRARVLNAGSRSRAFQIGRRHYDLGNELYRTMLDRRMAYSCAYWREARNLDDAQEEKLDLICRKLALKAGDRVLDVGCGWGSFAGFAAERYGAEVVGITVSKEQVALGSELCRGLPVELRLQDYRDMRERFDHLVSVGMFEHVGYKNYRTYMETAHACLRDGGLFLLHTIGDATSKLSTEPWLDRYIFPNSLIPSMNQIGKAIERLFVVEDVHNFGAHYAPTLTSWFANFDGGWEKLKSVYDERFYRMWKYYLLSSAGAFRSRNLQVWQIVLSRGGVPGGYQPVR